MMSKKSPQLRFEGFTDDWEERKLGDLTTISTGKLDANAMVENGKYDFYTSGIKKYRIDVAAFEGPSITIAGNGATVGYMHLADNKFNAYQRTYVLQEFLVDRSFIFSEIGNKLLKKIKQEARTGNIPYIVMDMLTELKLSIPQNNSEQQKIGSFFKQLDDTIDLHQRKLDLLKEQKKGYLQKMFPKNGAKVPELRFAGFADDWEERKLGDEVRIVMGQSPNSENYTDDPNDYILVQGNADMKNGRVFPRVWTTQVTKQAEKDDLILSVRAPVGDIGKTAYDVVIGRGVAAIKGNEFIFQNLGKMKSDGYWTRYSTGSTFESINSTDIKEAIISVPTIEEQNKIGSFFKQLDNTIALHQRKLDLLKEQKKGFLQKMFV